MKPVREVRLAKAEHVSVRAMRLNAAGSVIRIRKVMRHIAGLRVQIVVEKDIQRVRMEAVPVRMDKLRERIRIAADAMITVR